MTGPVTTEALVGELAKAIHLSFHPGANFEMARDNQSPGWMAADALAEQIAADFIAPLLAAHQQQAASISSLEESVNGLEAALQQVTAERDEARADLKAAEDSNDALNEKLSALAPHGSCACSYDKPGDVCMHHSPALATATSELARLRAEGEAKDRRIAALTEALAPFARFADMATPDTAETWAGVHHSFRIGTRFKHEHFRAARAATAREGA